MLALAMCLGLTVTALADGITDAMVIYTEEDEYGLVVRHEMSISEAGWSYDVDANILSLDGFKGHIDVCEGFGPLTIELKGDNIIIPWENDERPADQAFSSEDDITFCGNGTLTITGRLWMHNFTKNPPMLILADGLAATGGVAPEDNGPLTVSIVRDGFGNGYTQYVTANGEEAVYITIAPAALAASAEPAPIQTEPLTATPTSSTVLVNGQQVAFDAYNIGGANYFKLRDIGVAFDFGVGWDNDSKTITIDSSTGYTE